MIGSVSWTNKLDHGSMRYLVDRFNKAKAGEGKDGGKIFCKRQGRTLYGFGN